MQQAVLPGKTLDEEDFVCFLCFSFIATISTTCTTLVQFGYSVYACVCVCVRVLDHINAIEAVVGSEAYKVWAVWKESRTN